MNFSRVTEQPWQRATRTQMSTMRTRYGWAAEHAAGKDVLEVACGAGSGETYRGPAPDSPAPASRSEELAYYPGAGQIASAARTLLARNVKRAAA